MSAKCADHHYFAGEVTTGAGEVVAAVVVGTAVGATVVTGEVVVTVVDGAAGEVVITPQLSPQ
ncbi:hypothetical protein [Nocardia sp. NPDC056000]|uniref:hypothetical protein n=1 Tax=Nocardia sp. NPDC056000 TaxID=3345674 RepID=UPI0035E231CA